MKQSVVNKILADNVASYDKIANEFSDTRNRPWPEFNSFRPYISEGLSIADVGCGNGRLFAYVRDIAVNYTGIDNSARLIAIAQEQWGNHSRLPKFIRADMASPPSFKKPFDSVFFIASLQHIPSHELRQTVLQRWVTTIKPGGYLIMTNWYLWQPRYRKLLYNNWIKKIIGASSFDWNDTIVPWRDTTPRYYHAFTNKELRRLVTGAGLTIIEQKKTGFNYLTVAQKPLK